jgi:MarR family 2-MHQ and catechol resistance regulon transcriptional repressor
MSTGTPFPGTAEETLALSTYIKLLRATGSVKSRIDRHQTAGDLSDAQFGTLDMLYHLGPIYQQAIGDKLLISKSNVVAVIDKLEERGLVRRRRSREDRRRVFIHLTDKGRVLFKTLLPAHVAAIVDELSCLTDAEQKDLGRLCRKLGLNESA